MRYSTSVGAVAIILALTVLLFFIFGAIGHSIGGAEWAPEHVVAALKDTILAIVAGLIGFISGNFGGRSPDSR